ncbi:hypothetical protein L1987_25535 [Smallanthus sonchifolius]|uniref:Uncharacterized protein n=1 Tax=Smallanthus sonchifolius TaxID=185202 RepID=A0ACB9IMT7_9ASTR|nr:hypothetical protein L1987_25535 [Smallanthus sonchifolius]
MEEWSKLFAAYVITWDLVYVGLRRWAIKDNKQPQFRQIKPRNLIRYKLRATPNFKWDSSIDNNTRVLSWNGNQDQGLDTKTNPGYDRGGACMENPAAKSHTMHRSIIEETGRDGHSRGTEDVIMIVDPKDSNREDESIGREATQTMQANEDTGTVPSLNLDSRGTTPCYEEESIWDRINNQRILLSWPEQWGESMCTDLSTIEWENTMQYVNTSWAKEYGEGKSDLPQDSVFTKGACNPEEAMHRNKRKKRKTKGRNPFRGQKKVPSGDGENGSRRTIRVVSSKELNKDVFPQTLSIPKVMPPPLGFSEFKIGNDPNDKNKQQASKAPSSSRMDSLYKELLVKESRLKEIATNVLKTDANRELLHSILSMNSCNIRKFLAKVNDHGVVTVDEDMVDTGNGDLDTNLIQSGAQKASYAKMLNGEHSTIHEEKIQYYPPLVNSEGIKVAVIDPRIPRGDINGGGVSNENDGFTLVKGRRNGPRQVGHRARNSHSSNNYPNGTRNSKEGASTDNGNKRVNNASISMKNGNIVINGQSNHVPQDRGNV